MEHFLPFECVTFASSFSSCFSFLEGSFVPGKKKSRQHFMECFNSHFCSEPFFSCVRFFTGSSLGAAAVILRTYTRIFFALRIKVDDFFYVVSVCVWVWGGGRGGEGGRGGCGLAISSDLPRQRRHELIC